VIGLSESRRREREQELRRAHRYVVAASLLGALTVITPIALSPAWAAIADGFITVAALFCAFQAGIIIGEVFK
jgi:hypothetical protein